MDDLIAVKRNSPTIETNKPVIVGNVALAMPEAIALAFPVPVIAMISKTSIIPVTVPSKPRRGHSAIKALNHKNIFTSL